MVAIDVDRCSLVDLSRHQDDSVFKPHRQADFIIIEDLEYALGDDVILWVEIWVVLGVRS